MPIVLGAALLLSGCLAKTAIEVATAPIKIASKAVDLATTSQSEADEKRGRLLRQKEEELGKLSRKYDTQHKKCSKGDKNACGKAQELYSEIELLKREIPFSYSND